MEATAVLVRFHGGGEIHLRSLISPLIPVRIRPQASSLFRILETDGSGDRITWNIPPGLTNPAGLGSSAPLKLSELQTALRLKSELLYLMFSFVGRGLVCLVSFFFC